MPSQADYVGRDFGGAAWACDNQLVRHAAADVILFSGCEDDQCSADASSRYGHPAGAMTSAFIEVMHRGGGHTYVALLAALQAALTAHGFEQRPQVSSTSPFRLERRVALDDVEPPAGLKAGPVVRLPRQPCARREIGGGFGAMLIGSDAAGFLAATLGAAGGTGERHPTAQGNSFAADAGPAARPVVLEQDQEDGDEEDEGEEEYEEEEEEDDYDEDDYDDDD